MSSDLVKVELKMYEMSWGGLGATAAVLVSDILALNLHSHMKLNFIQ